MDSNGDSLDDRALVRSLIEQNGVCGGRGYWARHQDSCKLNIDINTTYLVIGDLPSNVSTGDIDTRTKGILDNYITVRRKAKEIGVREISFKTCSVC